MSAYGAFVWNWQLPVPKRPSEPFHTHRFSATKATPCSLMIHYVKYLLASCITHTFFSCWNLTKGDKMLKSSWKTAILLLFCYTLNSTPHPKVVSLPVSPADRFWPVEVSCLNDAPLHAFLDSFYFVWALFLSSVIHPLYGHFYYQHISPSMHHFSLLLSQFFGLFFITAHCLLSKSQVEETVSWLERKKKKARILFNILNTYLIDFQLIQFLLDSIRF